MLFFVYKSKCSFTGGNIISQSDCMTSQSLEYPSITWEEKCIFSSFDDKVYDKKF